MNQELIEYVTKPRPKATSIYKISNGSQSDQLEVKTEKENIRRSLLRVGVLPFQKPDPLSRDLASHLSFTQHWITRQILSFNFDEIDQPYMPEGKFLSISHPGQDRDMQLYILNIRSFPEYLEIRDYIGRFVLDFYKRLVYHCRKRIKINVYEWILPALHKEFYQKWDPKSSVDKLDEGTNYELIFKGGNIKYWYEDFDNIINDFSGSSISKKHAKLRKLGKWFRRTLICI